MTECPPQILPIHEITVVEHIRAQSNQDAIDDYANALIDGSFLPPIRVVRSGTRLYLADGLHRLEAHRRAGRSEIDAVVTDGTHDDALWIGLGANRTHGLRMTRADKRRAIRLALKLDPSKSNSGIAQHIGTTDKTVGSVRHEMEATSEIPRLDKRVGDDGRTRPVKSPLARCEAVVQGGIDELAGLTDEAVGRIEDRAGVESGTIAAMLNPKDLDKKSLDELTELGRSTLDSMAQSHVAEKAAYYKGQAFYRQLPADEQAKQADLKTQLDRHAASMDASEALMREIYK